MSGLALAYALHLAATVVWLGGLVALGGLVLPMLRRQPDAAAAARLWLRLERRFDPWAWFGLALLLGTGMFQMSASPNYRGFLIIAGPWAWALLLKHGGYALLALWSLYRTWGVLPALERALWRQGLPDEVFWHRAQGWYAVALVLALAVLVLTAVARAAA